MILYNSIKTPINIRILSDILLLTVPFLYIFSSLSLLVNIPFSGYHLALFLFIFFIILLWIHGVKSTVFVGIWLSVLLMAGWVAMELSVYLIDDFWDSRTYHGPATLYLANGWNPFYDWQCCGHSKLPLLKAEERSLLESYPKAQWIVTATVQAAFGHLEKTHIINLWLLAAVFFSSLHFLKATLSLSTSLRLLAALAIAANPVILCQVFSGYIDGTLAAALNIFLLSGIAFIHSKNRIYLFYSLIYLPLLINTKLTGLVYGTVFAFFLLAYAWWVDKTFPRQLALLGIGTWLAAVLIFGFNPYVTNSIQYHNPFHIAYSFKSDKNVISGMAAPEFINKNRFEKFLIATFSTRSKADWKKPEWIMPFSSLEFEPSADTRFSGFGPLFSGLLILTALLALFLRHTQAWVMIAAIMASIFITEAAWWARLAPQFWLVPILIVLFLSENYRYSKYKFKINMLSLFFLIGLLFNSTIVATNTWANQRQAELKSRLYYSDVSGIMTGTARGSDAFQLHSLHRLQYMGIEGQEVTDCFNDLMIKRTSWIIKGIVLCVPVKIKGLQEILRGLRMEKQTPIVLLSVTDSDAIQISPYALEMFKEIGLDLYKQEKTLIGASSHRTRANDPQGTFPREGIKLIFDHPSCLMHINIGTESVNEQVLHSIKINRVDFIVPNAVMNLIVIHDDEITVYSFPKSHNYNHDPISFSVQYKIKAVCS